MPFAERESKIKRLIYDFFVNHGINIFPDGLPIRNYLEHHANNIGNATLELELLNCNINAIFNQTITLQSNREKGVFDYFEKLSRDLFGYEPKQILLLHGKKQALKCFLIYIKALKTAGVQSHQSGIRVTKRK